MVIRLLDKDSNVISMNWIMNSLYILFNEGVSWRTAIILMTILAAVEVCVFIAIAH